MHHGMGHFDSSGKAVKDETSDFMIKNRDEIGKITEILFRAMNRRGEMAFESAGDLENLVAAGMPNEKRGGAEDLSIQFGA